MIRKQTFKPEMHIWSPQHFIHLVYCYDIAKLWQRYDIDNLFFLKNGSSSHKACIFSFIRLAISKSSSYNIQRLKTEHNSIEDVIYDFKLSPGTIMLA